MLKHFFCTKCGAPIDGDDSRAFIFCMRCGSRESIPGSKAPMPPQPAPPALNRPIRPGETPNLIIDYSAINLNVLLQVLVPETNQIYRLQSGMHLPLLMSVGAHILTLTIGRRSYRRTVNIFQSNAGPVIVHCSWDGRARINMEQPYANMGAVQGYYPQQPYPQQQYPQQYPQQQQPVNIYVQQTSPQPPQLQQIPPQPMQQIPPQPMQQIPPQPQMQQIPPQTVYAEPVQESFEEEYGQTADLNPKKEAAQSAEETIVTAETAETAVLNAADESRNEAFE